MVVAVFVSPGLRAGQPPSSRLAGEGVGGRAVAPQPDGDASLSTGGRAGAAVLPRQLSPMKQIEASCKGKERDGAAPGTGELACFRGGVYLSFLLSCKCLKVIRILYFPLLQDVLMNQCGKTTGLNLMVLYINPPYYITLALQTGRGQPSPGCVELRGQVVEGYLLVLSDVFRM